MILCVAAGARADTWRAEPVLIANPSVKCPDATRVFEFTVANGSFTIRTPGNATHSVPVAADGTVSLSYVGGLGTVVVSGNALTRQLQMSAPRTIPGCIYTMRTVGTPTVAEPEIEWKATVQQVRGNLQTCSPGNRAVAKQAGLSLFLYDAQRPYRLPMMVARLNPDGSFDGDVRTSFGTNASARLKVDPGHGPRAME